MEAFVENFHRVGFLVLGRTVTHRRLAGVLEPKGLWFEPCSFHAAVVPLPLGKWRGAAARHFGALDMFVGSQESNQD